MPDGRIEKLKLGNGLWESAKFNTRLQVTEFNLGHGPTSGGLWKLQQEYGEIDGSGNLDATKNTGNIARQTLSFDGLAQPFVTSYKYDSLYRLKEARETSGTGGSAPQTWKQAFTYDLYGNRLTHQKYSGTTQIPLDNTTHPQIDAGSNRFSDQQGYDYDKNGNLIVDPSYGGRQFVFNGDNKQKEVRDASNNLIGEYLYDGEGKRIKKIVPATGETTIFVYDAAGKLVAEYSSEIASVNDAKVAYLTNDHLGSPRITTDQLGQVIARHDYHPFGDEIGTLNGGSPHRTTALNYTADSVRQKFTGYERDNETDLDFAQARYFSSGFGRFSTPDDFSNDTQSINPQSWNLYIYVRNNPLNSIDPSGKELWVNFEGKKWKYIRSEGKGVFVGADGEQYSGSDNTALNLLNQLYSETHAMEIDNLITGGYHAFNIGVDTNSNPSGGTNWASDDLSNSTSGLMINTSNADMTGESLVALGTEISSAKWLQDQTKLDSPYATGMNNEHQWDDSVGTPSSGMTTYQQERAGFESDYRHRQGIRPDLAPFPEVRQRYETGVRKPYSWQPSAGSDSGLEGADGSTNGPPPPPIPSSPPPPLPGRNPSVRRMPD